MKLEEAEKKRKNSAPLELPKIVRLTIDDTYLSLQGKSGMCNQLSI